MKTAVLLYMFVLALIMVPVSSGYTQGRWTGEFRPGFNIPVNDLGDEKLGLGFGFEAKVAYKMMPHLKVYAGWGWNAFDTDAQKVIDRIDLDETSFTFGFDLRLPVTDPPVTYFVYGGAILGQIRLADNKNTFNESSNYGMGWQLGGGVEIALNDSWSLKPDVRYRSLSREVIVMNTSMNVDLEYFAIGLGVMKSL